MNAESLGFSKTNFASAGENVSWVLTRLVVRMDRYPKWEDEVSVATFPRGGRKIVAWRDFELFDSSGARLGAASSEWMLIDLATRRIVAIPEAVFAAADPADVPVLGEMPFTKFKFPRLARAEIAHRPQWPRQQRPLHRMDARAVRRRASVGDGGRVPLRDACGRRCPCCVRGGCAADLSPRLLAGRAGSRRGLDVRRRRRLLTLWALK